MTGVTEFLQKQAGKDVSEVKNVRPAKKKLRKGPKMDITAFLRKQDGKEPFEGMGQRTPQRRKGLSDEERRLRKISKIRDAIGIMSIKVGRMILTDADPIATRYLIKLQEVLFDGSCLFRALEKGEVDEKKFRKVL